MRNDYHIEMRPNPFWQILCVIVGHVPYRFKAWYFTEWGCHRCGLKFRHQWDLFTTTSTADAESLPQEYSK